MTQKQLIEKIDSFKKEADSLLPAKPEYEKAFWDKFRLEFNYNSNHLEGNTLTYDHTQLLLLFDKVDGDYTLRELEEMKAHDVAFKVTKDGALELEHILTEKFIKEINQTILVRPFYKEAITPDGQPTRRLIEPGQYKKYPNSVRLENGEIFNYASPEQTPAMMGDLIEWYRKETDTKELHPVQLAALFHYHFVRIHPFDDGNGRTSRLLMNYMLIRNDFAPVVIESVDKKNYLAALNKADTGNIEAFVDYITKLAFRWQDLYLKALKGEEIEEPGDFEKDLHLIKKKIINSEDKIERVFSINELREILITSGYSIISKAIARLDVFNELFVNHSIILRYPLRYRSYTTTYTLDYITNPEEILDKLTQVSRSFYNKSIPLPIIISFNYEHKNLKKASVADFNYTTSIIFTFNTPNYQIALESNPKLKIEKYYHQDLTEDEINTLLESIERIEMKEIKSKI